MLRTRFFVLVVASMSVPGFSAVAASAAPTAPVLVPTPKEVRLPGSAPVELTSDNSAIVLGDRPSEPALVAADLLQRRLERRFGLKMPILRESQDWGRCKRILLLGERATCAWVDRLCKQRSIELHDGSPGWDGYVVETVEAENRHVWLVGGCSGRGTLYGQDTLYQLVAWDAAGRVTIMPATIRDRPTIPWRGRPQTQVVHHLQPGMWDVYDIARVNFIDLRNGTYAFEPDYAFTDKDKVDIGEVIRQARRRDMVVFGTVNCAVPRSGHDAVLDMFRQFIALGANGLWISFDDKGPGEAPEELVQKVLALGRQHGLAADRIATTPPKGSYQVIRAPFNEKIMKVSGMETALWFWTPIPTDEELAVARSIGLKTKLSWWHNWPRPKSGFTHIHGGSVRSGGGRSYIELPAMSVGWHEPSYERLADCGDHVQAVMPWGGNAWEPYYVVPVVNWWGWSPERPAWKAARQRIYDIVFGPDCVDVALEFDDTLAQVRRLFRLHPGRISEGKPYTPPRLRDLADRPRAIELLERLDRRLQQIEDRAAEGSMLDVERLRKGLLEPMRAEVEVGKAAAALPFPEYWWDPHQRRVLEAVYRGDLDEATRLAGAVRDRVIRELEPINKALDSLRPVRDYVRAWTERAGLDGQGWKDLAAQRQATMKKRIGEYGWYVVVIGNLLKELRHVPVGWGRGKGDAQLRVLATVMAGSDEQFDGDWIGGPCRQDGLDATAFVLDREASCSAGDYSELTVTVPVSGRRDRLGLLVYMNRHTKDSYGLEETRRRWAGFCVTQLRWDDKVLWEADVGLPRNGSEWDLVRLPPLPESVAELPLRLRVWNLRDSDGIQGIAFVGPIRLVEIPE